MEVSITAVREDDRTAFRQMALEHFVEINPSFVPDADWDDHFVESCLTGETIRARWLVADGHRVGFVIYLLERHHFVPKEFGVIREVFVLPPWRRKGLASKAGQLMIDDLRRSGATRVFVDIMAGDERARCLWTRLGFGSHTERLVNLRAKGSE